MPQFFLPPEAVSDKSFHLEGDEAFHIVKVLRYREGQTLMLFDGQGRRFQGLIKKINSNGTISGEIAVVESPKQLVELDLFPGLLKAGGWDYALEKGTEIGVSTFNPVISARCVAEAKEENIEKKLERWRRVIMAAAKQCSRQDLPEIRPPISLSEAFSACAGQGVSLMAWEEAGGLAADGFRKTLRQAREKAGDGPLRVNLFIGPEGGFTQTEAELAEHSGVHVIGLGPRILRAETASLAACALVLYELNSL